MLGLERLGHPADMGTVVEVEQTARWRGGKGQPVFFLPLALIVPQSLLLAEPARSQWTRQPGNIAHRCRAAYKAKKTGRASGQDK